MALTKKEMQSIYGYMRQVEDSMKRTLSKTKRPEFKAIWEKDYAEVVKLAMKIHSELEVMPDGK